MYARVSYLFWLYCCWCTYGVTFIHIHGYRVCIEISPNTLCVQSAPQAIVSSWNQTISWEKISCFSFCSTFKHPVPAWHSSCTLCKRVPVSFFLFLSFFLSLTHISLLWIFSSIACDSVICRWLINKRINHSNYSADVSRISCIYMYSLSPSTTISQHILVLLHGVILYYYICTFRMHIFIAWKTFVL